jgi:hypothetical protein
MGIPGSEGLSAGTVVGKLRQVAVIPPIWSSEPEICIRFYGKGNMIYLISDRS